MRRTAAEALEARPTLPLYYDLPLAVFHQMSAARAKVYAPTGHEIPLGVPLSEIRQQADEYELTGEARADFLRIIRLCDAIYLEIKHRRITESLEKQNGKRG